MILRELSVEMRKKRLAKGLTLEQIANMLKVDKTFISQIENCYRAIPKGRRVEFLQAYGISLPSAKKMYGPLLWGYWLEE